MQTLKVGLVLSLCLLTGAVRAESTGTCDKPFEASLPSGSTLALDLRAADIDIVGVDRTTVVVLCDARNIEDTRQIRVAFEPSGGSAKLRVSGGYNDHARIRIEVPRKTHLSVRCTAGRLDIRGIRGDKDVRLLAGDLRIDMGDPSEYAEIQTSVNAGDLHLNPFGTHKGGLLRSFHRTQKDGSYSLRAYLWAGNVTLR